MANRETEQYIMDIFFPNVSIKKGVRYENDTYKIK